MPLDATPLANALQRLREGSARHLAEPNDEQLRDGLIQRFEFAYDAFIDEVEHLYAELKRRLPS